MEPEQTSDASGEVQTTPCKPCQSSWKPSRRELVQAALVATLAAPLLLSSLPAHALSAADCGDTLAGCLQNAENTWADCAAQCPTSDEDPLGYMMSRAGCNAADAIRRTMCEMAHFMCMAEVAAEEMARAMQQALDWMANHPVEVGEIIAIGAITFLVVVCAIATDGLCLLVVAAPAGV